MKVLIACEFSGRVREAFKAKGHDAWSCDILPTEIPGNHIQDDVLLHLADGWDLIIAHPPCTYLSYAANHCWNAWGRKQKREKALAFFLKLYDAPIPRVCIENPVGYPNTVFRKPDQIVEPFYFGDNQRKRTCLWLKNLPVLHHCEKNELFSRATHCPPPKPIYLRKTDGKAIHFTEANHGGHKRSVSFHGIANAMAEQWGSIEATKEVQQARTLFV